MLNKFIRFSLGPVDNHFKSYELHPKRGCEGMNYEKINGKK
jgi:hypothetical protein